MYFIRKTRKVGNSAGVLLPKKLLGSEVKVIVVSRPKSIKKDVMKVVEPDLSDILGIYILNKKPVEVIVISTNIKKVLEKEKIKISYVPLELIKKDLKTKPKLKGKLLKSEIILNRVLLEELKGL